MSNPKGPFVVAYALLALGATALVGVDTQLVRPADPVPGPFVSANLEAQMAAIEPAEGPAADTVSATDSVSASSTVSGSAEVSGTEDDKGPKKSFTGKVLSGDADIPSITIGMLKVETSKDLKTDAEAAFTPAGLRSSDIVPLLKRRFHFTPYAHDATRGATNAPLTLVEFSDLSCLACMDDLKKADALYEANAAHMRYVQVYLPVDVDHQTNLAAFYGKVAQRGGKFWEFRKALFDLKDPGPEAYFDALVSVGVPAVDARRWLTTEARRFYRELDADAQLSRALGLDKPPHFFVNGIHVGDGGIPRAELGDVLTYEGNYTHYQLDSLSHD